MKKECRDGLLSLVVVCEDGQIDLVIAKSITRFARNTLDCFKYIRQLKEKKIPVFFKKENINTMDSKGEVLLTIMVSLAQQESESSSKNVKLGLQFRYQNVEVQVNHNRIRSYTKDEKGHLIIEPAEAEIIKRIFYEYLQGSSLKQIGDGLMADSILIAAGKAKWCPEIVKKIPRNEKYIGDAQASQSPQWRE